LAENQTPLFADSIRAARERLESELHAQAEHILKLHEDLTELQLRHARTEQEASRQWDEVTRAAEEATRAVAEATHTADEATRRADEAASTAAEATRTADEATRRADEAASTVAEAMRTVEEATRAAAEATRAADEVTRAAAAAAFEPKISPDAALENVLTAVRSLMTCTIPDQVFEVLTEEASEWGVRAAIFDVRGKAAWGASAHGFGPGLTEKVVRSLIVQLKQDNPFRQVCETAGPVDASAETLKKNRGVLDKLKPAPGAPILLLPIRSAGTVTAIFYADPGEKDLPLPVNALKVLAEFAGAQIDRLIALSGGFSEDAAAEDAVEIAEPEAPAEEAEAAPEQPAEAHAEAPAPVESVAEAPAQVEQVVEEPVHAEHVDVAPVQAEPVAEAPVPAESAVTETTLYGQPLVYEPAPVEPPAHEPVPAEPLAGESALEAPPVQEPVEEVPVIGATVGEVHTEVEVVETPVVEPGLPTPVGEVAAEPPAAVVPIVESEPAPPVPEVPIEVAPPPPVEPPPPAAPAGFDVSQLSEAEQKVHKDAKRFARLLVSEIDLYNKGKVAEGRKNRDLYKRLKSDIDRSRQTFEKRFGKALNKQVDYFHDEMVKTLAANDASALGPEYPGPSA
jgi:hypothetical protein